jgi:hypothetical protein
MESVSYLVSHLNCRGVVASSFTPLDLYKFLSSDAKQIAVNLILFIIIKLIFIIFLFNSLPTKQVSATNYINVTRTEPVTALLTPQSSNNLRQ